MTNKELIDKLQNDRELPIMVVVNEDVIAGDEFVWWVAKIYDIQVKKMYYLDSSASPYGERSYLFYESCEKSEWWLYDELCDILGEEEADEYSYEELLKIYEELPWKDVIVIYVDGDVE